MCLALETEKIDGQYAEHTGIEGDPEPEVSDHQVVC